MFFYKGALSYEILQNMPIPALLMLKDHANIITEEINKAIDDETNKAKR